MELLRNDELPAAVNWILGTIDNVTLAVVAAGVYEVAKRIFQRAPKTVTGIASAYQNMSATLDVVIVKNPANKAYIISKAIELLDRICPEGTGGTDCTPAKVHYRLINYVASKGGFAEKSITPEMENALVCAMEIHRQSSDNCAVAPWCALTVVKGNEQFLCDHHNGIAISIYKMKEILSSSDGEISHVHTVYSQTKRWQTICIPMNINGMPIEKRIHSLWWISIDEPPSWQVMYTGTPIVSTGGYNCDTLMDLNPIRGGVSFGTIDKINKCRINFHSVIGCGAKFSTAKECNLLTAEWLNSNPNEIAHQITKTVGSEKMYAPLAKEFLTIDGTYISIEREQTKNKGFAGVIPERINDYSAAKLEVCDLDDFDGCWSKLLMYKKMDMGEKTALRGMLKGASCGLTEVKVETGNKRTIPVLMTQANLVSWIIARMDYIHGEELGNMYLVDGFVARVENVFEEAMRAISKDAAESTVITDNAIYDVEDARTTIGRKWHNRKYTSKLVFVV